MPKSGQNKNPRAGRVREAVKQIRSRLRVNVVVAKDINSIYLQVSFFTRITILPRSGPHLDLLETITITYEYTPWSRDIFEGHCVLWMLTYLQLGEEHTVQVIYRKKRPAVGQMIDQDSHSAFFSYNTYMGHRKYKRVLRIHFSLKTVSTFLSSASD